MLSCQRDLFHLPPGVRYLNCAYMSPLLKSVEEAGVLGIRTKADPTALGPEHFFEDADRLREAFARLVGGHARDVAIIPAVSYGMAVVARNLDPQPGQNVVMAGEQFPSNVYPWRALAAERGLELRTVARSTHAGGSAWTDRILSTMDRRTALVALPQAHWTDGTLLDLDRVGQRARELGAAFVVDGTQTVGAHPFDVGAIRPDALICAGYKWLLGPYSLGLMWIGERFREARPVEETWIGRQGSEDFRGLVDYRDAYRDDASRLDVGERSNPILVPMLLAAIEQVLSWSVEEIAAYCRRLTSAVAGGAGKLGWEVEPAGTRCSNIVGVRAPRTVDVAALKRLLEGRRVAVSFRGTAVRVSPHVYNDDADVEALLEVLHDAS